MSEENKPTPPKTGLAASIADMAGPILDKLNDLPPGTKLPAPTVVAPAEPSPTPPAAPAPPATPPEDEADMPAEIKSDKGRKAWKHYKAETGRMITDLKAKIAEFEKKPTEANTAELTALEQRVAAAEKEKSELMEKLKMVAVEQSPDFQEKYIKRTDDIITEAKTIVGKDLANQVEALLQMPDGEYRRDRLAEVTAELNDIQKAELGAAIRELRKLSADKTRELGSWKDKLAKQKDIIAKEAESARKSAMSVFDAELAAVRDASEGAPVFQPREGDKQWNDWLEKAVAAARELYTGENVTPQERAKGALWATAGPLYIHQIKAMQAENSKLTALVEQLRGQSPDIKDGGGTPPPAPAKPQSLAERMADMAKAAGLVR